jgi:hypothetical protein
VAAAAEAAACVQGLLLHFLVEGGGEKGRQAARAKHLLSLNLVLSLHVIGGRLVQLTKDVANLHSAQLHRS